MNGYALAVEWLCSNAEQLCTLHGRINSEPVHVSAVDKLELPAPIAGHQIVEHTGYTLSWNKYLLVADWVAMSSEIFQ